MKRTWPRISCALRSLHLYVLGRPLPPALVTKTVLATGLLASSSAVGRMRRVRDFVWSTCVALTCGPFLVKVLISSSSTYTALVLWRTWLHWCSACSTAWSYDMVAQGFSDGDFLRTTVRLQSSSSQSVAGWSVLGVALCFWQALDRCSVS